MPVDYTRLEEGDALNASSLNTVFSDLRAALNDIEMTDVAPGALDHQHLPDLSFSGAVNGIYSVRSPDLDVEKNGVTSSGGAYTGTGGRDQYENFIDPGTSITDTFAPGATATPHGPVKDVSLLSNIEGWRIVCFNGLTTYAAELTLASDSTLSGLGLTGLLIRGDVGIYAVDTSSGEPNPDAECLAVGIGFEDSSGDRFVVARSVRYFDRHHLRDSAGVMTFLTDADLNVGEANGVLHSVFMVVAGASRGVNVTAWTADNQIDFYNLSWTPFVGGAL